MTQKSAADGNCSLCDKNDINEELYEIDIEKHKEKKDINAIVGAQISL